METRLFKVTRIYVNLGEGKTDYRPAVKEVCIIKETPKSYLCMSDIASGWSSRISKDDRSYSFSEVEAWDKFIARAKQLLIDLRSKQGETSDTIRYAKEQRCMSMVKIGGTD